MTRRLSSENLHATAVSQGGRAVLLLGPSGSGKSDLALRLLDRGFSLVSDDRTLVRVDGERLLATAPERIRGKMEVRGIGIVTLPFVEQAPVALAVELTAQVERFPLDSRERVFLGVAVPAIGLDPTTASASAKVAVALDHLGLAFA